MMVVSRGNSKADTIVEIQQQWMEESW